MDNTHFRNLMVGDDFYANGEPYIKETDTSATSDLFGGAQEFKPEDIVQVDV